MQLYTARWRQPSSKIMLQIIILAMLLIITKATLQRQPSEVAFTGVIEHFVGNSVFLASVSGLHYDTKFNTLFGASEYSSTIFEFNLQLNTFQRVAGGTYGFAYDTPVLSTVAPLEGPRSICVMDDHTFYITQRRAVSAVNRVTKMMTNVAGNFISNQCSNTYSLLVNTDTVVDASDIVFDEASSVVCDTQRKFVYVYDQGCNILVALNTSSNGLVKTTAKLIKKDLHSISSIALNQKQNILYIVDLKLENQVTAILLDKPLEDKTGYEYFNIPVVAESNITAIAFHEDTQR